MVTGFVAAQVVSARWSEGGLELRLRPTLASSPTVMIAAGRKDAPELEWPNRYVCKVRLAR